MAVEKLTPIRKFLSNGASKKSLLYLGIVILAGLICLGFVWHFSKMPESKKELPTIKIKMPTEEEIIKKQLEELESLRTGATPLTEKEIKTQLKELQNLQK